MVARIPNLELLLYKAQQALAHDPDFVQKIAEIKDNNSTSVYIKKELSSKYLIAKKEGYRPTPLKLETKFDAVAVINILFWPGFVVDAATGQMCKWDNTYIDIEMEK